MINKKDLELKLLLRESHIQQLNLKVDKLQQRINKAIELLKKYNDKENNYYVPVDNCIDILKGVDKEC